MCGIQNMREQSFLTATVQNMKRLAKPFCSLLSYLKPVFFAKNMGFVVDLSAARDALLVARFAPQRTIRQNSFVSPFFIFSVSSPILNVQSRQATMLPAALPFST